MSLARRSVCCPVRSILASALAGKEPSHESGCGDVVPATTKGRVNAGEKVIQMGGNYPHAIAQGCRPSASHEGKPKCCPWQEFDGDLNHKEIGLSASIVLGEGVDEGEDQSYCLSV